MVHVTSVFCGMDSAVNYSNFRRCFCASEHWVHSQASSYDK
jgi:hypothetical protein